MDVKDTQHRLKSSKSLQDQVNRDIMDFVSKQLKQFDNLAVLGFEDDYSCNDSSSSKKYYGSAKFS